MDTIMEQILATEFSVQATPVPSGTGYRLRMQAQWRNTGVRMQYRVQLVGLNPLTGKDVAEEDVTFLFSFEQQTDQSGLLRYHGKYTLMCYAILDSGEERLFKEQPITLRCPDSCPYLSYTCKIPGGFFSKKKGYRQITMESNCWPYCQNKVWLHFDGHDQLVVFPPQQKDAFTFYLVTDEDPTIRITDKTIALRKE